MPAEKSPAARAKRPRRKPGKHWRCWTWAGIVDRCGYGRLIRRGKKHLFVHRVMWEAFNDAKVPDRMTIDHLCRNRACANPQHMQIVTPRENTMRGFGPTARNARKTHCIRGHELVGPNLVNSKTTFRVCRVCRNILSAARKESKRANQG